MLLSTIFCAFPGFRPVSCALSVLRLTCGWLKSVAEHARMTVPLAFACVTEHGGVDKLARRQLVPGFDQLVEVGDDVVAYRHRVVDGRLRRSRSR